MLRRSWFQILKCVSEIDMLHLVKSREVVDATHFISDQERVQISNAHNHGSGGHPSKNYKTKLIQEHTKFTREGVLRFSGEYANAAMVAAEIPASTVDKIFADSIKLDNESIVHFCIALAAVSAVELDNPLNPRVFSLRKIIEVAHDNIHHRIPLIWQRIWSVLAPHFVKAGLHRNVNIGEYSINSLRQLAGLFFEKEELTNFQFQSKFLQPFHQIMEQSKNQAVRLLIVECIFIIVKTRFTNVKSGWKAVMSLAAKDPHEMLVSKTYDIMESILQEYFPLLRYKID
ncbi:guanine nucleotide exchange family protein, partial [Reticulomyxa filosa]